MMDDFFSATARCLSACEPDEKVRLVEALASDWPAERLAYQERTAAATLGEPGRPALPLLVHPREVPKRRLNTVKGRAALIHAITHIEFNAINLALDAIHRFAGMASAYYRDWLRIAAEEARHFQMLRARLRQLGYDYGDFTAHDGLWEMARKTAHDVLLRMALVPRVLEARGLDVTPGMIARLRQVGDDETAAILRIILDEEIGHVAVGSHWFRQLCLQRQLEPERHFQWLLKEYLDHLPRGPFNVEGRMRAGFGESELAALGASADGC